MPRTKSTKRAPKRVNVNHSMGDYQRLEKEFMGIPGKFAAQVKKDIAVQKQKENKIKAAWNKSRKAIKAAEARVKAAAKNKTTSTGKKQFNTSKKVHADALKVQTTLNKQLSEVSAIVNTLASKYAKLAALSKHLNSFNKEWAKQAKNTHSVKATSKRKTRKARAKTHTSVSTPTDQYAYETPEAVYSDTNAGETTEAAS